MKHCPRAVSIARPSTLQPTELPSELAATPLVHQNKIFVNVFDNVHGTSKFPFTAKIIMIHLILSDVGINFFSIIVSDTFDGTPFPAGDFSLCKFVLGYPKHGDVNNIFSCETPQKGRYVGITADNRQILATNPFTICEIAVHTRNGKVYRCNQPKYNSMDRYEGVPTCFAQSKFY